MLPPYWSDPLPVMPVNNGDPPRTPLCCGGGVATRKGARRRVATSSRATHVIYGKPRFEPYLAPPPKRIRGEKN